MSNLEHLLENGLIAMQSMTSTEWEKQMRKDPNWEGNEHISIDDLWEICQYVIYRWSYKEEFENE